MVISYYLWKIPYSILWEINNFFGKIKPIVFYCADELDWIILRNVYKHISSAEVVAKNRKVQSDLKKYDIDSSLIPSFPKTVVMARHALHLFPGNKITKIGLRHGAYHFKKMIDKEKYNAFNLYFMTSAEEVRQARLTGITSAVSGGFPVLDDIKYFDANTIINLKRNLSIKNSKPTLLFTATWNKSGVSAINYWYDKLESLKADYNVMVTVHPFTDMCYINEIKKQKIIYIDSRDILPFIAASDVVIGDTSSILAESCALNKPMITFVIKEKNRLSQEIIRMIEEISYRVSSFDEMKTMLRVAIENPDFYNVYREKWNKIMFDYLDQEAGRIVADKIISFLH